MAPEYHGGAWWHRQPDGTLLRWNDADRAWQPAPAEPGPELPLAPQAPYQPLATRATVVRWLILALILVSLVAAVSDAFEYDLLRRIQEGSSVSRGEVDFNDIRQAVLGLVQAGINVALIVAFLMWFRRAYDNLSRLGATGLRYRPGWAVGAWFVPILNLFRPKQIANDIWRGSDPSLPPQAGQSWRNRPVAGVLHWWWALWLLQSFLDNTSARLYAEGDTAAQVKTASLVTLASDAFTLVTGILLLVVVRETTARQEARAEALVRLA